MLSISVITPSLNQGGYIERTIQSVLNQNVPDLEYMVIDGGSTDGTPDLLTKCGTDIRWISEQDKGQADAVNKGIRATTGEIIGWLNSDDIYYPEAVWFVSALFERHPDVDVIYGKAHYIGADDQIISDYPTESWNEDRLRRTCYICQPSAFFRRRCVERFGLLDDRLQYCLDYEFWLRLSEGGAAFLYVSEFLSGSRLYPEAKTLESRIKTIQETNHMLFHKIGYVPDEWLLSYARIFLNRRGIRRIDGGRLDSLLSESGTGDAIIKGLGSLLIAPLFATAAVLISLYASLHWNRRIHWSLIVTLIRWLRDHGRAVSKNIFRVSGTA